MINLDWLRMFSYRELQTLISGSEHAINLADLRAHTKYGLGFDEEHTTIQGRAGQDGQEAQGQAAQNYWTIGRGRTYFSPPSPFLFVASMILLIGWAWKPAAENTEREPSRTQNLCNICLGTEGALILKLF